MDPIGALEHRRVASVIDKRIAGAQTGSWMLDYQVSEDGFNFESSVDSRIRPFRTKLIQSSLWRILYSPKLVQITMWVTKQIKTPKHMQA